MHDTYTLFGTQGCGSTIVAAALALTAFPWGYEEVDYTQDGPERDRLLALNPLGQVPTLVLPNDEVMTESAAIILLLHDRAPHAELVPPGGSPLLPRFLRWLLFINAEIYPTFTYADHPQRWQPQAAGAEQLKNAVMDYRERLLQQLNAAAGAAGPWFLGKSFSGAAAGGIQRLALRGDRAAGGRDGQFCTKPALARVLECLSFSGGRQDEGGRHSAQSIPGAGSFYARRRFWRAGSAAGHLPPPNLLAPQP